MTASRMSSMSSDTIRISSSFVVRPTVPLWSDTSLNLLSIRLKALEMSQDKIKSQDGGINYESKISRRFDSCLSTTSPSLSPEPNLRSRSKTAAIFSSVTGDFYRIVRWAFHQRDKIAPPVASTTCQRRTFHRTPCQALGQRYRWVDSRSAS